MENQHNFSAAVHELPAEPPSRPMTGERSRSAEPPARGTMTITERFFIILLRAFSTWHT